MKKHLRTITLVGLLFISMLHVIFSPITHATSTLGYTSNQSIFAADSDSVDTTFFGNVQDDGKGCSVYLILNTILDILTGAVGITAVVGITIVGVQYLTAKGNEQQATKAKHRIFEIIIGIVAYVMLYSALSFLLPGGKFNNSTTCSSTSNSSSSSNSQQKTKTNKTYNSSNPSSENNLILSKQIAQDFTPEEMANQIAKGKLAPSPVCTNCPWSQRLAQTAIYLSWPLGTSESKYHYDHAIKGNNYKKWSDLKQGKPTKAYMNAFDKLYSNINFSDMGALGADCGKFIRVVIKYSGIDMKGALKNGDGLGCPNAYAYFSNNNHWEKVKKAQTGDICFSTGLNPNGTSWCHIIILVGKNTIAEANHTYKNFGHLSTGNCKASQYIYHAIST